MNTVRTWNNKGYICQTKNEDNETMPLLLLASTATAAFLFLLLLLLLSWRTNIVLIPLQVQVKTSYAEGELYVLHDSKDTMRVVVLKLIVF
jgi:hypothetical protein